MVQVDTSKNGIIRPSAHYSNFVFDLILANLLLDFSQIALQ